MLGLNWGCQVAADHEVHLALHSRQVDVPWAMSKVLPLDSVDEIKAFIEEVRPTCLIHTAGLTSIELCEKDPALAKLINTDYAINVAAACRDMKVPMVHISTDNLFDGTNPMVDETQTINPVNVYGKSKADAESGILEILDDSIIVRTNFYGWGPSYKYSFSDTIINSLRSGKTVSLFEDVHYTPILISELILAVHLLLESPQRGIFNICSDQRLSKYEFGIHLANVFNFDISLIRKNRLSELKHLVNRPYDMSMSNKKICEILGRKIGDITTHLNTLKQQEFSNKVRGMH